MSDSSNCAGMGGLAGYGGAGLYEAIIEGQSYERLWLGLTCLINTGRRERDRGSRTLCFSGGILVHGGYCKAIGTWGGGYDDE